MQYNKTAVLLSGGIDSICIAYWKKPDMAFTIDYGQVCAEAEIHSAAIICKKLGIEHHIIRIDCSSLGSGLLSGKPTVEDSPSEEWWPYRNQLLVTLACMKGISLGVKKLYVGSVRTDGVQHKDGTPEFYDMLSRLMSYQEGGITVEMPAHSMDTYELVEASGTPLDLLLYSHSCHVSNKPCMKCKGCEKNYAVRLKYGIG